MPRLWGGHVWCLIHTDLLYDSQSAVQRSLFTARFAYRAQEFYSTDSKGDRMLSYSTFFRFLGTGQLDKC